MMESHQTKGRCFYGEERRATPESLRLHAQFVSDHNHSDTTRVLAAMIDDRHIITHPFAGLTILANTTVRTRCIMMNPLGIERRNLLDSGHCRVQILHHLIRSRYNNHSLRTKDHSCHTIA